MAKKKLQRHKPSAALPRAARAPTKRTTQLTDLPVEILEQIWSEAPNSTRPISRLLLPMTQANLYRRIDLPSIGRIWNLFKTVSQCNPTMAWRVRYLSLAPVRTAREDDGERSANELNQIRQLLHLLINVEELKARGGLPVNIRFTLIFLVQLHGVAGLADVVLDERFAQHSMRRLEALELCQWSEWLDAPPFSYSRYEHLSLYPELRHLKLASFYTGPVPSYSPSPEPVATESEKKRTVNSTIKSLTLNGRLSDPSSVDLVARCESLTSLALRDLMSESNLNPLLEAVNHPRKLVFLEVYNGSADRFEPVDDTLSRFENLESLHLSGDDTFSDATFEVLVALPLKTITFYGNDMSVDLVQDLVVRSKTLSSLHLHLPFLGEAEAGATIDDWRLPRWTADFTLGGARELQDLARAMSVEICEQLTGALDLEDHFEETLLVPIWRVEDSIAKLSIATASTPTDSLSSLPSEVIQRIFAYASDLKEPISQALLVGTNANLYTSVKLYTYEAAASFCRAIASRPSLGDLVQELKINFGGGSDNAGIDSDDDDEARSGPPAPVRVNPTHDDLVRLFAALPLLRDIHIMRASRFADVLLGRTVCTGFLGCLEWINLRDSFDSFRSPWDVGAYANLRHIPKLVSFWIYSSEESNELDARDGGGTPPIPQLGDLLLRGPFSSVDVANLVAHFPAIYSLELEDHSLSQDYNPILLRAPESLLELDIQPSRFVPESIAPIDSTLARFQHLEQLGIPDDMVKSSTFDYLRDPLPLTTLNITSQLRDVPKLSAPHFLALLRPGPGQLSALESLEIEIFPGEIGTTLAENGNAPFVDASGKWQMSVDWLRPEWGPHFSHDDAVELVEAAETAGVELLGGIREAIEVDRAFAHEETVLRSHRFSRVA